MRLLIFITFLLLATTASAGLRVVTTIQPIHSITASIMQGVGKPELLIPATTSPHHFNLRPSQRRSLEHADLLIWVGDPLEGFMPRIISSLPDKVLILSLLGPDASHHEHGHEDINPHIWLDPIQAIAISEKIRDALIRSDAQHSTQYRQNTAALKKRLLALDEQLSSQLKPVSDKSFIVFHDAYSYLVERYNLKQVGIVTLNEHQPSGGKHLQQLRTQLKEQAIPCLFTEPQFEPAIVENLIRGTSTRVHSLDPVGSDYATGPNAYFEMMQALGHKLSQCLSKE